MNPLTALTAFRAWRRLHHLWKDYRVKKEPVMITAMVQSAAVLLSAFGLDLTGEQVGSIAVVASLLAGVFARSRVSPVPS